MTKRLLLYVLLVIACGDDDGVDGADAASDAPVADAPPTDVPSDTPEDVAASDADETPDVVGMDVPAVDSDAPASDRLWIDEDALLALPMSGAGWEEVLEAAEGDWGSADISGQDNNHDVYTFAGALVAVRTGDDAIRARVESAIESAVGTEEGTRTLALGRQLLSYVLAADLIGYREPAFLSWLGAIGDRVFPGRAGIDTLYRSATEDPSNWGCHARASMIAIARFLGDDARLAELAEAFEDDTGRSGERFTFRELFWQADPENPVGINPVGATIEGRPVDGVIPDDQRRGGEFTWPPPRENYVWESLQGTTAAAHLLQRAGYPAWEWESQAIRHCTARRCRRLRSPAPPFHRIRVSS